MDLGLHGLTALITGASRGLGYASARQLALEGCNVAINSRDAARVEAAAAQIHQETGARVLALPGDVTDPALPESLTQQTAAAFGGLDILITNAGGPPPGKFDNFDDDAWQRGIDLSLMCHVRLIRAALPHLRRSPAASVLTITSVSVKQPISNLLLSNSIRAATVGLTKSLALDLGPEGIRFNSILPSWTETERVHELMENRARANQSTMEEEMVKQARETALGRMGSPQEFANVAAFLVSPAASYLTGVMLSVDGGAYKGVL
ncbi:MAG: SDR family oxidoreductase [Chloroflexi bacterium]|nr:SDR family oxidoreductase [Chloroflexota bacterium]